MRKKSSLLFFQEYSGNKRKKARSPHVVLHEGLVQVAQQGLVLLGGRWLLGVLHGLLQLVQVAVHEPNLSCSDTKVLYRADTHCYFNFL